MNLRKGILVIGLDVLLCLSNLSGCSPFLVENVKPPQENPYPYEEESKYSNTDENGYNNFAGADFIDYNGMHFCDLGSTILFDSSSSQEKDGSGFNIRLSSSLDGKARISVSKTTIYDDFSDAGIPKNDLIGVDYFSEKEEFRVVILDLSVENVNIDFTSDDPLEDFNISNLVPAYLGDRTEQELMEAFQNWSPDINYFSGHRSSGNNDTNGYHFRVQPGEKEDFQMGFYVPAELIERKEIALQIGAGTRRTFFFDILGTAETK